MFKFDLMSVDGNSTVEYSSLEEFADSWTHGQINFYDNYVTSDGITKISPADEHTKNALKLELYLNGSFIELMSSNEELVSAVGVPIGRELKRILLTSHISEDFGDYVDTDIGRAFVVSDKSPEYDKLTPGKSALEGTGLPPGSLSFRDTYVMHDELMNQAIIFDTRKEATSIEDLLVRAIDKTEVLIASIERYEGFDDDGIFGKLQVFGDKKLVDQAKKNLGQMEEKSEWVGFRSSGYDNSQKYPMTQKDFYKKVSSAQSVEFFKKSDLHDLQTDKVVNATKITKELVNRCGSSENGIYVEGEGNSTEFVALGSYLKHVYIPMDLENYSSMENRSSFVQISREERQELVELTPKQKDVYGMPF